MKQGCMGAGSINGDALLIHSCHRSNNLRLMVVGPVSLLQDRFCVSWFWFHLHWTTWTVLTIVTSQSWQDGFHAQTKMADVSLVCFLLRDKRMHHQTTKCTNTFNLTCRSSVASLSPVACMCMCVRVRVCACVPCPHIKSQGSQPENLKGFFSPCVLI